MIFLDTSAIYALADRADQNHKLSLRRLQSILDQGETLFTHNYVLLESVALLQSRLGLPAASKLSKDSELFKVDWVDKELHDAAVRQLQSEGKRHLSLVDHVSFLVMSRYKLKLAFAFDPDFKSQGFALFEG